MAANMYAHTTHMAGWPGGLAVCGESSGHPLVAEHKRGASRGAGPGRRARARLCGRADDAGPYPVRTTHDDRADLTRDTHVRVCVRSCSL